MYSKCSKKGRSDMSEKLAVFSGRLGTYLSFKLRIYQAISLFYRLFEKRRSDLHEYKDIPELVSVVRNCKWRPDSWRQLWDTIGHPKHVQWLIDHDPGLLIGDCDDFACYEAEVINQQLQGQQFRSLVIYRAEIVSVLWRKDGRSAGHNVCLIELLDPQAKSFFCYMDYGWPSLIRSTRKEVVADVLGRYSSDSVSLGWARSDSSSLKPLEVEWRLNP
jgi:hypothetical protein